MPKFIRTMKNCVMRILVVTFQRFMVEAVCIHDSIDSKLVIMRRIMIKLIYIRKYVFETYKE